MSPLDDVMQLRVSVLPHAQLSPAWAGESMYTCHASIGWSEASAVCLNVIYGRTKTTGG